MQSLRLKPVAVLLLLFPLIIQAQKKDKRPNIIYIMADDLGFADLSCYGQKKYTTPNIDKLAAQGVKFNNAYAAAPVCTPTRAAFMTGKYPARTEVGTHEPLEWSKKDSVIGLSPSEQSMASLLKNAGYETYLVGKWHLGFSPEHSPMVNGFDYFYGFHGGGIDYVSHSSPRKGPHALYENDKPILQNGYMTDLLRAKTNELVRKKHDKPFFMALMFNAPHWPWQAPGDPKYPDTLGWTLGGSPEIYAQMMKSMDDAVGELIKTLDEENLSKNTIIIFTSDNGGERFSDMGIYKGSKMQLWEGGIRVPAMVKWPEKIKPGTVTNQVAITMDWTTTILSLAKASVPKSGTFDGIDLSNIIMGKKKEIDRTLYWRISQRRNHMAARDGQWKYLKDEKGTEYLFDLNNDPSENNNLKESQAVVFEKLKNKYAKWTSEMKPPILPGQ